MKVKQVAFLVLAHHQPERLVELLDGVRSPWSHAFVHVCRKADRADFEARLAGREDCTLLPVDQCVAAHWAGYTLVEATLRVLGVAHADPRRFERFVLLSGVDLPLRPPEEIGRRLSMDGEFIRVERRLDPEGDSYFDRCANRIFLGDSRFTNPRSKGPFGKIARAIEKLLPRVATPKDLVVYKGPTWWALSRHAIDGVFAFIRARPDVMAWFRWTRAPDELIFQTILKADPALAAQVSCDLTAGQEDREPTLHGVHFVDWSRPNPDLPRVLELEDAANLRASSALFARKFDSVRSAELVTLLRTGGLAEQPRQDRLATVDA